MDVRRIENRMAHPFLLKKHYARRIPSIQYAFALVENDIIQGVVTYGPPASPNVGRSCLGEEHRKMALELNRLCVDTDIHCAASILVSRSLKLLPPGLLVVSYADSGRGHLGVIYQASNFIYCGARKSHDQEYIINGKSVHARTLTGKISNPRTWAKANNIQTIATADKHRYVFPTGNKRDRRYILSLLKWEKQPFPKGKSRRYDAGEKLSEAETSLAKPIDPQGELF